VTLKEGGDDELPLEVKERLKGLQCTVGG